jgi:uroporphyrinogen-III synthase
MKPASDRDFLRSLAGRRIVVTRPAEQAAHLCEALIERGAIPLRFPVLAIAPVDDPTPLLDAAIRLDGYQLVVFVSPNAVEQALSVMLRSRRWPDGVAAGSMGRSSEAALAKYGVRDVIAPQTRFDSEALLEEPRLADVRGWKVLICRGDGGRELLADELRARGAEVDLLTCYTRSLPKIDPAPLLQHWEAHQLDAVTLTSSEGVRHFATLIGHLGLAWWRKTPTFVSHARIADAARAYGLQHIVETPPADAGLLDGLETYFAEQP